jgi:hypothetical protein
MNRPFKDYLTALITLLICGFSIYLKLQFVVVACLIIFGLIVYKTKTEEIFNYFKDIISNTRQAEFGKFKLEIKNSLENLSTITTQKAIGFQLILSKLKEEHLSLIMAIYKEGKFPIKNISALRILRNYGLLKHDQSSMAKSSYVWLSLLGNELAQVLSTQNFDSDSIADINNSTSLKA